ncbi:hypothetical protein, partial [Amnibacterium endophyticum]
ARTIALIRRGGRRADSPVVAAAALGLTALLRDAPATAPLGDELGAAAVDAGARVDLPSLQAVRDALPARVRAADDPAARIRALLESPAARL